MGAGELALGEGDALGHPGYMTILAFSSTGVIG